MNQKTGLFEPIRALPGVVTSLEHIAKKEPFLVSGVGDSAQNHLSAALSSFTERPFVIVTPNEYRAREVYDEIIFYDPEGVYLFPAKDPLFYSADVSGTAIYQDRMKVFRALKEGTCRGIVMSFEALYDRMIPRSVWESFIIRRRIGEEVDLNALVRQLSLMGYERVDTVGTPGEFAVRGGIIDVYPTGDDAYRIELWGDEIDSIRNFDITTQRSLSRLEYITIYPASEAMVPSEAIEKGAEKIKAELETEEKNLRAQDLKEEADHLHDMTIHFLDRIATDNMRGLDAYLPLFYDHTVTVLDYLDPKSILFFQEPARIKERVGALQKELSSSLEGRLKAGYLLPSQMNMFPDFDEIQASMAPFSQVFLCSLLSSTEDAFYIKDIVRMNTRSMNVLSGDTSQMADEIRSDVGLGYQTVLLTRSAYRAQKVVDMLRGDQISAYLYEDLTKAPQQGSAAVAEGLLKRGFSYPDAKFTVISLQELSEQSRRRSRRHRHIKNAEPIDSFSELKPGDYVVHENHGIGIFQGIVQLTDEDSRRDYFKILYKDGGVLYVPTTSLDILQKYAAVEGETPRWNKLAGSDWQRTKGRVQEGVNELAEKLAALYAERQSREGYAFSQDNSWQQEFEQAFPYEETDDQLAAIEDTKKDMESTHIMDRLICGDVGFGKTEVALRAAFKAVQDSKQVALLAPTTILAQQHYNTFVSRMKDYPIHIGLLSRFNTPKQMKETLYGLRAGTVDIVIGTHRLLSKDVVFKDLGLLIVDEEQRFGVAHKERIKELKKNVDVLTLSATPIPRTLHMSLSGIRDMSLLEEAPEHRHPVQTYVMEDDDELVKEAIYRELSRSGQVFYLYNRVETIERAASRVMKLVPEARVEIVHGQMDEKQMEQVMLRFVQGEIDVLVCTTIVENGLDIPNANTIIVNDADRFGLSQLYQLRGRVGRSSRLAYAYFLYPKGKVLDEAAQKRLEAISEYTQFGSGYKIALRDLQLRGAGNILGPEQHGHMGAVGYDLYCKMLREAMNKVKDMPVEEDFETAVYIQTDAFIPSSYISHEGSKLETYKKIAAIRSREDYEDMIDELIDRYSDMPQSVTNLLMISYIKALAKGLGADEITEKDGKVTLRLRSDTPIDPARLTQYLSQNAQTSRLIMAGDRTQLVLALSSQDKVHDKLTQIIKLLETLQRSCLPEDDHEKP